MNHNPVVPNAPPTMSCVTDNCRRDIPVYCDGEGRVLIQRYSASSPDCDTADKYTWTSELGQNTGCGYMVEPIVRMLAANATAITLEMSVEDDEGNHPVVGNGWMRTSHTDALEALRNGGHWQTREIAASWEQSEPDKYCVVSEDGHNHKAETAYGFIIEEGRVTRWPDMMEAYDVWCIFWNANPGGQFYGEEGKTGLTEKYSENFAKTHSPILSRPNEMRGLQKSSTWLTMKPGFCCSPQNVETLKNPQCEIETCQTNTSLNEAGDKCCADRAGALTYGNDCEAVQCVLNKHEVVAGDCVPCEREAVEEFADEAGCVVASCVDGYVLMNMGGDDVCVATSQPTTKPTSDPTFTPTRQPAVPLQPEPTTEPPEPVHPEPTGRSGPKPPQTWSPRPEAEVPNTEVIIIAQPSATASVNWLFVGVAGLGVLVALTAAIGAAWYRANKDLAESVQPSNTPVDAAADAATINSSYDFASL